MSSGAHSSLADHLYIETDQAAEVLQQLCEDGLAGCNDDVYWFNTAPTGQLEVVRRLTHLYSKPPHTRDQSRPREAVGIRRFAAEAFKFRKDK